MVDVLLDSTFLLPFLGFEVREVKDDDIEFLRSQTRSGKIRLYCSIVSFVEIFGKLARKQGAASQESVETGIRSLLESGNFEWISPSTEALSLAFQLRLKGHADNIDNILYATASTSKMYFLSLDLALRDFLAENDYDEKILIDLKDLSKRVS